MRNIDAGRQEAPSSVEKRKPSSVPAYRPLDDAEMFISLSGASPLRVPRATAVHTAGIESIGDAI
jgi:hypothetical protein